MALSMSNIADAEHAFISSLQIMPRRFTAQILIRRLSQEVVRVVLLDAQHRCVTEVDIARGCHAARN